MAKYKVGYFPYECMIITEIKRPEAVGVGVLMFKSGDEIELSDKEYTFIMDRKLINGNLLKKVAAPVPPVTPPVVPTPEPAPAPAPSPAPAPTPVEKPEEPAKDVEQPAKVSKPGQKK